MSTNQRKDPAITGNIEQDVIELRATMTRLEQRATLKYLPGWQSLRDEMLAKLAVVEIQLDNFQNMTDKGRDFLLKERIDLKWVLSQVEDVEEEIAAVNDKLVMRQRALNERKQAATADL